MLFVFVNTQALPSLKWLVLFDQVGRNSSKINEQDRQFILEIWKNLNVASKLPILKVTVIY